jgi:hypothetical protein
MSEWIHYYGNNERLSQRWFIGGRVWHRLLGYRDGCFHALCGRTGKLAELFGGFGPAPRGMCRRCEQLAAMRRQT